jgi:hypothetical protein
MPAIDRLKSAMRPLLVATVIGATGMVATPAMAQAFNFQLNIPGQGGGSVEFGFGNQGGGWNNQNRWPGQVRCLTDREIRQGVANNGYHDVQIGRELGRNRVQVFASYGPWVYSMRLDRCTGVADRVQRERRVGGGWGGGGNWGGGGGGNWGGGGWGGGNWR